MVVVVCCAGIAAGCGAGAACCAAAISCCRLATSCWLRTPFLTRRSISALLTSGWSAMAEPAVKTAAKSAVRHIRDVLWSMVWIELVFRFATGLYVANVTNMCRACDETVKMVGRLSRVWGALYGPRGQGRAVFKRVGRLKFLYGCVSYASQNRREGHVSVCGWPMARGLHPRLPETPGVQSVPSATTRSGSRGPLPAAGCRTRRLHRRSPQKSG